MDEHKPVDVGINSDHFHDSLSVPKVESRLKAFFKIVDNKLIPHDAETLAYIARRKDGEVIVADIKRARSYPNHKRFMSFIAVTFDMQEHFDSKEAYRYWITMKAGWFDPIVVPNGNTIFKAKSIAFENMEEEDFRELFSSCIDVFLKELGKGMTEADILRVIEFS